MIQTLLKNQRDYLNHFFDTVHFEEINAALKEILSCKGVVILSGVGKSGHITQKIAATLISTGTKASFLSPSEALHGDIGFLSPEDIFVAFSKSGESQELLDLLPHVQRKGLTTIAIVSQTASRLAKMCSLTVHLPVKKELCPYNLAPTTSTVVQLLFGDCLAIALMQAKQFTVDHFAHNHPAGFLGRKIAFKVSDLMLKKSALPLCSPENKLIDLLHELSVKRCGCLIIIDEKEELKGIFTDGDLRRAIQTRGATALQEPLGNLMTCSPETIAPDVLVLEAVKKMEENPNRLITTLLVVEKNKLIGLIRMHDILQMGLH